MARINTSNWGEFEIGTLFEVSRPATRSQAKYEDGGIPFVASGNYNNGVVKYCKPLGDEILDKKDCISVSPLDGSAFYQPYDFLGRGGAGSAILLLRNENMKEMNGLFISSVLRAALTKFSYNDQINSHSILTQTIKLPVTCDGSPDWDCMEQYMQQIFEESKASLENLGQADSEPTRVDTEDWGNFVIGDLFPAIIKPPVYHTREVTEDDNGIPYVVRTKFDNGIKCRVIKTEDMDPSPAGVITFGAENATFFYQEEEFVSGRDIYYIDVRGINRFACLFLTACLQPVA